MESTAYGPTHRFAIIANSGSARRWRLDLAQTIRDAITATAPTRDVFNSSAAGFRLPNVETREKVISAKGESAGLIYLTTNALLVRFGLGRKSSSHGAGFIERVMTALLHPLREHKSAA